MNKEIEYKKIFNKNWNLTADDDVFANIFLNYDNSWSVKLHKSDSPYVFKTKTSAMGFAESELRIKYHAHEATITRPGR